MIPGLQDANFVKYGVMHKNTYINSPELLDETYRLKKNSNIYFAGQITGVEGYVESIASGLVAGINACDVLLDKGKALFSENTIIGSLTKYISSPNDNFQPINANFGILPELKEKIRDKKIRYEKYAKRSIEKMKKITDL